MAITRKELSAKAVMKSPIGLLATWFGSGLAPFAPGTMGTIAAMPFAWALQVYGGSLWVLSAALIVSVFGVWVSDRYMAIFDREHDPKEVVIDEVAGVWLLIGLLFFFRELSQEALNAGYESASSEMVIDGVIYGLSFILFRFFDILKPWPISWADRQVDGGLGVMLDDILAAFWAIFFLVLAGFALRTYENGGLWLA